MPKAPKKTTTLTILGHEIALGESKTINFNIAKLYTSTKVEIPIIVTRAKKEGPIVLITGGVHGDEVNGVEIVRQLIHQKINRPLKGTIICIPVLNVFGFLSMSREFPDGKDLNRVFPGSPKGSLASRFAYQFTSEILPLANYCLDFHTGGASRFNAPQIRVASDNTETLKLAHIFNAPFTVVSKNIPKSYRNTCTKLAKQILLFEGGKSQSINTSIVTEGVNGTIRILKHLEMFSKNKDSSIPENKNTIITASKWIRAKYSGLFHNHTACGSFVKKGESIASITDPYGKMNHLVKASNDGFIINTNESPIVYQGDAIFHISTTYD